MLLLVNKSSTVAKLGLVTFCALGTYSISGCSKPANLAQATGVVTLGGEPVAEAKVMFHPVDGGPRTSYGTTNEKGEFKVSTFGMNDGALVGRHVLTVSKVDMESQAKFDPQELATKGYSGQGYADMMGPNAAKRPKPKFIIPEKYSNKDTSGIEVDVVKGETNNFPIQLEQATGK